MIGNFRLTTSIDRSNDDVLRKLVEGELTHLEIPMGTTKIGAGIFNSWGNIKSVTIPEGVTTIGSGAFQNSSIEHIQFPNSLKTIGMSAFHTCKSLSTISLNEGLTTIHSYCFNGTGLTEVLLPSTLRTIGTNVFYGIPLKKVNIPKSATDISTGFGGCTYLEEVTMENGFNCNKLDLSSSTLYSVETIVSWLEALADRTGQPTYTLIIGADNLAKLTEEQIAIATAKNWTLA